MFDVTDIGMLARRLAVAEEEVKNSGEESTALDIRTWEYAQTTLYNPFVFPRITLADPFPEEEPEAKVIPYRRKESYSG